jgi:localization factor PodJL
MTYRNFSPEMLNAGRARRQMLPLQQEKNDTGLERSPRGAAVNDLTRELEAIASELGRLKSGQAQLSRPANIAAQPPQSAFDTAQLTSIVQSLKADVRTQMRDDLDAQYVRLRDELDGLNAAIAGTSLQGTFKNEISSLLSGLETLASGNRSIQNSQDKLSSYLQRELGDLQSSLQGLAKNDSLTKLDNRWNSLETRWNRLEDRIDSGMNADSGVLLSDISARLSALQSKMNNGGMESLENRLLILAKSVDALAHSHASHSNSGTDFSQIDKRFDELSRAVAAIGAERATPAVDNQAIDQIEQTMALLGRKLELVGNMSGQNPSLDAIEMRLSQLNDRFAELPNYFNHEPVMERIDRLAEKVSALPSPSLSPASIDALTQQLNTLAGEVRGNIGGKPVSDGLFDRLDGRLGSIEERLSNITFGEPSTADADAVIAALEQRFSELSAHLEAMQPVAGTTAATDISGLEQKLSEIARQLKQNPAPVAGSVSFDRLESQIADLSSMLGRQPTDDGEAFAARFDLLENLLSRNQQTMLETARQAAEDAALRFQNVHSADNRSETDNAQIVSVIAGELASLEQMTRNSNERSTNAFEGIHGALIKIADRLAALESTPAPAMAAAVRAPAPQMPKAVMPFEDDGFYAPGLEAAESDLSGLDMANEPEARKPRSPSVMAQEAANAALRNLDPQTAAVEAALETMPGGELEDVPLNPGTAVPDLNSILKRVRDQKKAAQSQNATDVDRKDYIRSAKRAAQAAAAEVLEVEPSGKSSGALGNIKTLYAKFRRPILMVAAAAVVAIAALQLSSAFVASEPEQAPEAALQLEKPVEQAATDTLSMDKTAPTDNLDVKSAESANPQPLTVTEATDALSKDTGVSTDPLKDVATIAPQAADTSAQASPRIVGAPAEQTAATESASVSPDAKAAESQADGTTASPDAAAATNGPTVPKGFGPQALIEAVNTKDMKAQFEMGRRLADNQNDPALLANAFAWFNASAAQGFAPAQYRVGNMYEKGLGVERSASDAKLWYQMAAEAGNASAMHNLAVLFASGADGTVDSASALRWFQKAADLGVGDSQFNLGVMKGKGQGVEQDLEESYKWLALLAKSGDTEAATKRDEVAQSLRPEQLKSAKAKVELWKPQVADAKANDLKIPDSWKLADGATASVDVKKAVKNVQLILTKLGYNVGTPDGVMGDNTRKAIRAFQKKEKLAVTGNIDGPLVKALLAKNG